jgi:hypothetical protein
LSEFSERLKDQWSRVSVRDRRTQLTLAGSLAAIVLLVAVIAWSTGGGGGGIDGPGAGTTSERAAELATELAEEGGEALDGAGPLAGGSAGTRSDAGAAVDPGGSAPASLPPITDTTVKVGITYVEDPGTANAAAGFAGIGQVDQRRGWEAMIREVNKNPPLGRKVVPVWYSQTTDEIQSKGAERIEQEACAHFTQDNPVFLVWDGTLVGQDTFQSCATRAKLPEIGTGGGLSWSQTYRQFPYVVEPNTAGMDRMAAFQIDRLHGAGYFSKFKDNAPPYTPQKPIDGKPKIGLIRYDQPSYKAGATAMKRRLAAHGLSLCNECEFEVSYSSDNIQEQLDDATEVNAAIQSFKAKGVTHVMFLGSTAGTRITLFFIDGAEKQQYRPRLGFNPLDSPHLIRNNLGPASYAQFRQSVLVTWNPAHFDVQTEAFKRCKAIFEEAGETFGGDDRTKNKEAQIALYCNTAWYFAAAMQKAGRSLSLESWMNGVHTVDPVPSVSAYLMQTKANRHDGIGAIRIGEWFDDCNCFKPTSGIIPV